MRLYLLSTLSIFCAFGSLGHAWRRQAIQPTGYTLANNHFGTSLLRILSQENEAKEVSENIFFSPYSITMALSMLYYGLDGDTSDELGASLGFKLAKLADKPAIGREIRDSIDKIVESSQNGSFVLQNANALIASLGMDINDDYEKALGDYFDAEKLQADFSKSDESLQLINGWVSNKTNGKIPRLLQSPPSSDTKLALLNAIYFKGSWKLKFNANQTETNQTFYGPKGTKYEGAEFMNIKSYFNTGYLSEIKATLIELPYESDDLSMYAILPDDKQSDMEHIKKALNPWYIEAAIDRTYNNEIKIRFPKLKFETRYGLVPILQQMGVSKIFSSEGDFSGIANSTNLAVGDVQHAATIDINEEGSEASASTYVTIIKLSVVHVPTYEFDHPFLFFIRNNQNGNLLFIGEVNQV